MKEDLDDLLPSAFDVDEAAGDDDFDLVPRGWYSAAVERAEINDTRGGKAVNVAFIISGPKYQGRWVWVSFNVVNKSAEAQAIAHQSFAKLCKALGLEGRPKIAQLMGQECDIRVVVEESTDPQYDDKNVAKSFAPFGIKAKSTDGSDERRSAVGKKKSKKDKKKNKHKKSKRFDQSFNDDDIPF